MVDIGFDVIVVDYWLVFEYCVLVVFDDCMEVMCVVCDVCWLFGLCVYLLMFVGDSVGGMFVVVVVIVLCDVGECNVDGIVFVYLMFGFEL